MEAAIKKGDIVKVRKLLAEHTSPDLQLKNNQTPLLLAATNGRAEIVKALIQAAFNGHTEIVKALIEAGANLDLQDVGGDTALLSATTSGYAEIVKALIEAGAKLDTQNTYGYTALLSATTNGRAEIVNALIEAGANSDLKSKHDESALILASTKGYTDIVKSLIGAGANVDLHDADGNTPLIFAAFKGRIEIAKALIDAGANVDIQSKYGDSALIQAAARGHIEIANALIDAGANVNTQETHSNNTALMFAALHGYTELVKSLIEAGANVDLINKAGNTALRIAIAKGHADIIKLLKGNKPSPPWKGWTRSDSEKLDTIFDEKAADYACCPVCLKFVERSDACMYMKHDCASLEGFYHTELYDKYKTPEGKIGWCTICGRIAVGHRHYMLGLVDGPKPNLLTGTGDPFEDDCRLTNQGGGLTEKLARFHRMREVAKELMSAGEITEEEAHTKLVEETWNAGLVYDPNTIATILAEKRWNFPHTNYSPNSVPVVNAATEPVVARNFPRPAPNRNNAALQPIVYPKGMNQVMQDEDADNVIQFHHRKKDGMINNHEDTMISKDSLEQIINWKINNFKDESAIYCWEYPKCDALLYPEEIKGLVPDELYESYKTMFNQQMTVRQRRLGGAFRSQRKTRKNRNKHQRGGQQTDFFKEATDAECVVILRKPTGGRRKTHRRNRRISRTKSRV